MVSYELKCKTNGMEYKFPFPFFFFFGKGDNHCLPQYQRDRGSCLIYVMPMD